MKILFVHQGLQSQMSYVVKDLEILSRKHNVRTLHFKGNKDLFFNFLTITRQFLSGVIWCDITFSWFGKIHALFAVFFSKFFHKKSIVVAGGDDVVYAPEINYGMFTFWWKKWCPLLVYKYTDLILPPGQFHNDLLLENAKPDPRKVRVIPHGFDYYKFKIPRGIEKNGSVISVGIVNEDNLYRKGLRLFIESASYLPDVQFLLIGPNSNNVNIKAMIDIPENVELTGGLYGDDLIKVMSEASVYVQVSEYEGFGCSLAEAMLCECVPVVSRKTAIPMVVGDCGIYVDDLTPDTVAEKIRDAISSPNNLGKKARERIKTHFSLEKRKIDLLQSVESIK